MKGSNIKFMELLRGPLAALHELQRAELCLNSLGLNRSDVACEIGCGAGITSFLLSERCKKVIAIDISPKMIKKAQDKIDKNNWENIELICADLTKKDLNIKADAAIFCLVLSLIPNYEEIICKTIRLLKSNSLLVAVD